MSALLGPDKKETLKDELGVTSALAFDLVATAINDSSALAVGIMYSVFTGSWIVVRAA